MAKVCISTSSLLQRQAKHFHPDDKQGEKHRHEYGARKNRHEEPL